jgi:uncharacterized alkaline shock family protein YloU
VTDPLVLTGPEGSITLTPSALAQLVAQAAQTVEGARVRRPRRSVEVEHGAERASVSLELAVRFGEPIPDVARSVQTRVAEALAATSGFAVERVDVTVEGIA